MLIYKKNKIKKKLPKKNCKSKISNKIKPNKNLNVIINKITIVDKLVFEFIHRNRTIIH